MRCSTNNKGEAPSTSNRYTSSTLRSAMRSWIRSKAKSSKPTVTWSGLPVSRPPSSPCISNRTYKKNPWPPSLRIMSVRCYTPPGQTGCGLPSVLLLMGREILQDGLNESLDALGGYDQVVRQTTDSFKKVAKQTLKCKASEALTTSKCKMCDLFG